MRRAIIAALTLLGVMTAGAVEPVRFGVKAEWDLTCPSTSLTTLDDGSGVAAGALVNVPLWRGLYVEPGVEFFYNTMDISFIDFVVNGHEPGPNGYIGNTGMRVPVAVGYKFSLAEGMDFSVFTGVNLNIGLGMKAHFDAGDLPQIDMKSTIDLYDGGVDKFDTQLLLGVRFAYFDNFFADISGGIGLHNICKDKVFGDNHIRRNTFSIGVGYMF